MAFAKEMLSCHCNGAWIHGIRPSSLKRTALSPITSLLAWPQCVQSKINSPIKARLGAGLDERELTFGPEMQGLLWKASLQVHCTEHANYVKKGWLTLGVAMTGCLGSYQFMDHAQAIEDSGAIVEATPKNAPEWVAPVVLGVPVVSYLLFTLYRYKVNPYAKLSDWVYGLAAMAIVGNLILIATAGVRLY